MPGPWLYDLFMAPLERAGLWRARRKLVRGVTGRTLEVGAGTGLLFRAFDRPPDVAIDVDLPALKHARRRSGAVPLVCASAEALPFREGVFDTVVESLAFCTIGEPVAAIREVRRVLKKGGELRMLEHVRPPGPKLAWLFDRLSPAWRRISGGCNLNRRTPELLAPAGFEVVEKRETDRGIMVRIRART